MNPPHSLILCDLIFLSSMSSITRYCAYKSSLFFLVVIRRLVLEPSVEKLQKSKKNPLRILHSNLNLNQEIIKNNIVSRYPRGFRLLRKRLFFSSFFKTLQLVHARNRPIPQPFAQFLVGSNSHQYDSREWPPSLCFLYKGHDEHKYPL